MSELELTFIPYDPAYREAFCDLNKVWLEAYFLLEPYDIQILSDAEAMVLKPGCRFDAPAPSSPRRPPTQSAKANPCHENHPEWITKQRTGVNL